MKKVLLILAVMLLLGTANAHASPVEMDLVDLYDWGRLYDFNISTNAWDPITQNPYDLTLGTSIPAGSTIGYADGLEDSWGIAQVDQILLGSGGPSIFDKDLPGSPEITIFFWGFDDDYMGFPDALNKVSIGSVGGRVEVWQDVSPDYNPALGIAGRSLPADGSHYDTVTDDGTLLLDLVPVAQNAFGHTLVSDFNFNTFTGGGDMFLNIAGGTWASAYDTNTQLFGSDLLFSYEVRDNVGPIVANWTVKGGGSVYGDVIPEPASMTMFGIGLMGLVGALKKKKRVC